MAFAFWAFLAVVVVIQAAPVMEEKPWNAEVNFGPEENFLGKSRRSTGDRSFNPLPVANPTFYSLKFNSFNEKITR